MRQLSTTPPNPAAPKGRPARKQPVRPTLEALEDRVVPTISLVQGVLFIEQTSGNDHAQVSVVGSGDETYYEVIDNDFVRLYSRASVAGSVKYYGHGGNDTFKNFTGLRTIADGGFGNDTLVGGSKGDLLHGGYGADRLVGGISGDDHLFGGFDNDQLLGGTGLDDLHGDHGNDYLDGGKDGVADSLEGGFGADTFVKEWATAGAQGWNRDLPQDFSAFQGDKYTNQVLAFFAAAFQKKG